VEGEQEARKRSGMASWHGDEIALLDLGAVGDEFGKSHAATLTPDFGDEDFGGVDGFDEASDADFAFGAGGIRWCGMSDRQGGWGAGGENQEQDRDGER
jgi:hypothetical protein